MAGKRSCSLFCAPQPIARLVQLFPKLALVFFAIHITVIIYSFFSPNPHAVKSKDAPPGVVDEKMKFIGIEKNRMVHANLNISEKKILHVEKDSISKRNKTESLLLKKLHPEEGHDSKRHPNLQKRNPKR